MKNLLVGLFLTLVPYAAFAANCEVIQQNSESITYTSGQSTVLGRYHYHFHPADVSKLQDELLSLSEHKDLNAFSGRVRSLLASKQIQDAVQRAKSDFQFLNQQISSKKIKWIGMEQTEETMQVLVAQIPDMKAVLSKAGLPPKDVETFILAIIGPAAYFWYENAGKKGVLLVGMENQDLLFKAEFLQNRYVLEERNFHEAFKESKQKSKSKDSIEIINKVHDELTAQILKSGKVETQKYSAFIEGLDLDPESQRALLNYADRLAEFMNLVPARDKAAVNTLKTSAANLGNGIYLYGKAHLPGHLQFLQQSCGRTSSRDISKPASKSETAK